ncbi:C_GCAxxG_C_C family protein [bacterium]|nr:C_GCAxxG_C_C family protein [bacterium]
MNREQRARELFRSGYNCSQSVFGAYAESYGIDFDTALKLASSFGGGMGRLREVCGAVSGMFLALGLIKGYSTNDYQSKKEHYKKVQHLAQEFEKLNGSIVCRELLGLDKKRDVPTPEKRTEEYYKKRPCEELIADACRILDKYLLEENNKVQS